MSDVYGSASEVLAIPEILHLVFACLKNENPTLAACIRVNKLWMSEAARVLWACCGSLEENNGSLPQVHRKHLPLRIRDLLAIRPVKRRQ